MKTKPFDEKFLAIIGNEDTQINVLKRVLNNDDEKFLNLNDVKDFIYLVNVLNSVQKAIDIRNASKLCKCSLNTYKCSPLIIKDVYEHIWEKFVNICESTPNLFAPYFSVSAFLSNIKGFEPAEEEVLKVLEIEPSKVIKFATIDSNDNYELVYIDYGGDFNGANYTVLRNKVTGEYFVPQNGAAYPITMTDALTYVYAKIEDGKITEEKTMLTTKNKMKTVDEITRRRLAWLNNSGYKNLADDEIFDGISFVWAKGHTLCVRSQKDIEHNDKHLSYIAIYANKDDVKPTKFFSQYRLV